MGSIVALVVNYTSSPKFDDASMCKMTIGISSSSSKLVLGKKPIMLLLQISVQVFWKIENLGKPNGSWNLSFDMF